LNTAYALCYHRLHAFLGYFRVTVNEI
jgi:hypothetical protein